MDHKDRPDQLDQPDRLDLKDRKDHKDYKDRPDPLDLKDRKDHKDRRVCRGRKVTKAPPVQTEQTAHQVKAYQQVVLLVRCWLR